MNRYSVVVSDTGLAESLKLLVPFQSSATSGALVGEVVKRASRYGKTLNAAHCTLRLESPDGPILDPQDTLSDLVVDGQLFAVFSTIQNGTPFETVDTDMVGAQGEAKGSHPSLTVRSAISVRIITPAIAKLMTKDSNALPAPAFNLPASAKLQQLHDNAVRHLSNNAPDWLDATSLLDLHMHELPIVSSCFDSTLDETGLAESLKDGVLTIYAVARPASTTRSAQPPGRVGKNDLYAAGPHWQPEVPQSNRGVAMFLSSLRVFTHVLKSNAITDEHRERVVHVFDLLSFFPPAVRALHLLIQGSTISHSASTALSQAFFCILKDLGHRKLIKNDDTRLFEGARLLFGLIIEKANQLKSVESFVPVYSSHIHTVQLQSMAALSAQPLMPVNGGPSRPAASSSAQSEINAGYLKLDLVSESKQSVVIFSPPQDIFTRAQTLQEVICPGDLRNLHQLASLCGKASLSVVRPSLLSSVAPEHLTFDEQGHVAVYTGKAGCAGPGEDTVIFRPMHGEETPNMGQVEQRLAPILQAYEEDGTNVFDILGSSATRSLDEPDEIVMFCVDCSASMDSSTDLMGIDADSGPPRTSDTPQISPQVYNRVLLDDTKKALTEHEVYDDVLGCVAECAHTARSTVAAKMLTLVFDLTTEEIEKKRSLAMYSWYERNAVNLRLEKLENLAAGLKRFEQELVDMIILRTMAMSPHKWTWNIGERLPGYQQMEPLPDEITMIPVALRCPIKLDLIEDPVVAADGQTYGRQAMVKWMSIRRSSPLTGLMLENTELRPQLGLAEQADKWLQGEDLVEPEERPVNKRRRTSLRTNAVTFSSTSHHFSRALSPATTLLDLYKIAYRGMRGHHNLFQLSFNGVLTPSLEAISNSGIVGGSVISIVIADNVSAVQDGDSALCLIKAYSSNSRPDFCYWVPEETEKSMASILAKYWRFQWTRCPWLDYEKHEVWTDLKSYGDNRFQGHIASNSDYLMDYLTPYHATGVLQAEPIHSPPSESPSEDSSESDEEGGTPKVLVLKVKISAAAVYQKSSRGLSRLEVLKQMFEAMVNRMIAYSYKTHIGLITFNSTATVSQSITHVIENFRRSVESMNAQGDTALWDGLKLAQTQIMKYAEKYPKAQRRIICLSDGNDNKSTAGPADLCWQLRASKILVDSVCIGDDDNKDLKALSGWLKSYCFYPKDLTTALAICEMEPVLSQTERPAPPADVGPMQRTSGLQSFFTMRARAAFTTVTQDVYPKRKEHPRLEDTFVQLANCVRTNTASSFSLPTLRVSRLLVEMREMAANPHPKYDCYVSEADMFFWKVVIEGPPETPYENSSFLLYLEMPENFPAFPPKGRFVTPLFHPNINRHGRICHSIFDRDWTTDTTLKSVLDTVYGLLLQAEAGDAVHTTVTLGFHHDEVAFAEEARRHARKHGYKTRQDWKIELLDLGEEDEGEVY
ncbi:hypothetical protein D6C90_03218 [Aureobasidium pullulans]|uniref:peptidylprolyl isomerase n=1 Tax=Aureobasidium pullulans TaxID=5580 RepID=A0A4S9VD96_AURPU|nr:hypothetical protein D6C90_03218 [Aureobasidium pullulans]